MMRRILLVVLVFSMVFLISCNKNLEVKSDDGSKSEYFELNENAYGELQRLLATRSYSGESRNYYSEVQLVAPNADLTEIEAKKTEAEGSVPYYLSIYRFDRGKCALVYDENDGKPDRFIAAIYYTKPIDKGKLLTAKTAGDLYELLSCKNDDEFKHYFVALEDGLLFNEESKESVYNLCALIMADDGFYVVEFDRNLLHGTEDGVALNKSSKIVGAEKADPVDSVSDAAYTLIDIYAAIFEAIKCTIA